jgi:hypothetical protein
MIFHPSFDHSVSNGEVSLIYRGNKRGHFLGIKVGFRKAVRVKFPRDLDNRK